MVSQKRGFRDGQRFDLDEVARRTERFTGADLGDVVRRTGLVALRRSRGASEGDMAAFEEALTGHTSA